MTTRGSDGDVSASAVAAELADVPVPVPPPPPCINAVYDPQLAAISGARSIAAMKSNREVTVNRPPFPGWEPEPAADVIVIREGSEAKAKARQGRCGSASGIRACREA